MARPRKSELSQATFDVLSELPQIAELESRRAALAQELERVDMLITCIIEMQNKRTEESPL